ncbi:MAG: AAA family ATPase, partial [Planctomycetes bacterium]|nr:AAA family ATPase [Planctomycetota bacterium]
MVPRVPLGTSDFLQLREDELIYVDKSLFVVELLADPARVLLLPGPRRFGKTLNLSTVRYFFERPPRSPADATAKASDVRRAFSGLAIEKAGEEIWSHFQRHPVIFLTFKDQKGPNWSVGGSLAELIVDEALRHAPAFEASLTADERKMFEAIARGSRPLELLERSLFLLTRWLHRSTGE